MNIHEYQAKEILRKFGVPVPEGGVAFDPDEARRVAERILTHGVPSVVVKAQIHAGGRGKAGGIKLARSAAEARDVAAALLGTVLVTHQTGPLGRKVRKVLVEVASTVRKEFYLAVLVDRAVARPAVIASTEGGVDIEAVAARAPEKIVRESIDPTLGLMPYQARRLAFALQIPPSLVPQAAAIMCNVYRAFVECDASLVEINPLAIVTGREADTFLALDAKFDLDDNALFRHRELLAMRDWDEEDPIETEASKYNLNYVKLDGNIGCLVNGAGLAMATMDIIKHHGGEPANFLDVGGNATTEQVSAAFTILCADKNVRAILVNIFGGIVKCDVVAEGLVSAAKAVHIDRPLIVRLEGTNVEQGRQILKGSGLPIVLADSMDAAARKAVEAARVYTAAACQHTTTP